MNRPKHKAGAACSRIFNTFQSKLCDRDGVIMGSFTPRQIAIKHWTRLDSPEAVRKAADVLADYDRLRRELVPSGDVMGRGRPSERYTINPAVQGIVGARHDWLVRLKKSEPVPGPKAKETTKRVSVVFVAPVAGSFHKSEVAHGAANDPAPDVDRWAWPHSTAMNEAEIDTFTARLMHLTDQGLRMADAEGLADYLTMRDRSWWAVALGYGAVPMRDRLE